MLDRIVGLWRRRKWIALLAFAAPASMVLGLVTSLPNIYRSTASILVERQQVPEAFVRPTVTGEVETRLQTITQEIFSRTSLEGLITRFNLYARLRARLSTQNLVARMRNDIILVMKSDATNPGGAKMVAFTISYRGSDPAVVAEVTNTLAALFIDENLRVRSRQATGTANFLRAQLEETTRQLEVQEGQVSDFNRKHMGELPQQMNANLAAIEQLSTQLRLNNDRQTLALARREALERQLADVETAPAMATASGAPDTAATRLARLRNELRELRTQYTEKYPEVVRVKAEIAALEREQSEKKSDAPGEAAAPTPQDPAIRRLQAAPNRSRFVLTGLIFSLGLAAAAVVLAEQLDTSFHAIEELRTFTKIPVLVGIAGIATARDTVLRRRRFRLATALAVLVVLLVAGGSHLAGRGNATLVALLSPGGS